MPNQFPDISNLQPMNLKSIQLNKRTSSRSKIVSILETDGFFLNRTFSSDFRIRASVYKMLRNAKRCLPKGLSFCIYEAYRPLSRQIELWESTLREVQKTCPNLSHDQIIATCEYFVANPYDGIGSGHQACCAIDITLCTASGHQLDMGTAVQEFNAKTPTDSADLSAEVRTNRDQLKQALESVGFINYPAEWWHYSYGDHQWAWLKGKSEAIYGPISLSDLSTEISSSSKPERKHV